MTCATVYGAAKAALENFGRSLAVELAPEGIRVNTIAPDFTATPAMIATYERKFGASERTSQQLANSARMQIPIGRPGAAARDTRR